MSVGRHTAYNLAGAVVPLVVSLVTVPIYLEVIGLDRYGVLAICWLLLGYFGLFDFGLGRATAQKIAALADRPAQDRSEIFWTSALLSTALGLVALIAFVPLAAIGFQLMQVTNAGLRQEIQAALPFLAAAVPFGIAQSLLVGALEGRREFLKINIMVTFGTVATATLPLLTALLIGPQLANLLAAALATRAAVLIMLVVACIVAIPLRPPKLAKPAQIRRLLQFGGWITVSNVLGPLMVFWDRFAIGVVLGSAAVAVYVVPFNLVWQIVIIPAALTSALFPRLAYAKAGLARDLASQAVSVLAFVMTPGTLFAILAAPPFLSVWLGSELGASTAPVACILLFGIWINGFGRIPHSHLQARERPHVITFLMMAELLPYAALLYLFMRLFGLPGAAAAWSLRSLADTIALFILDENSTEEVRKLASQAVLIVSAVVISVMLPPWEVTRLLLTTLAVGASVWCAWRNKPPPC